MWKGGLSRVPTHKLTRITKLNSITASARCKESTVVQQEQEQQQQRYTRCLIHETLLVKADEQVATSVASFLCLVNHHSSFILDCWHRMRESKFKSGRIGKTCLNDILSILAPAAVATAAVSGTSISSLLLEAA